MKFSRSVEIDLPLDKVVQLFDNPDSAYKWQPGFVRVEQISGASREPGSKAKLTYLMGKRTLELIETIKVKNLPHEISGLYEHIHMVNTMTNYFHPVGENKTKYEAVIDYVKFNHLIPKVMALLMPGMFKKQVQVWLEKFKEFAESVKN